MKKIRAFAVLTVAMLFMLCACGKTIIPFCSHGGGRFGQSLTAISKLAPDAVMGDVVSAVWKSGAAGHGGMYVIAFSKHKNRTMYFDFGHKH